MAKRMLSRVEVIKAHDMMKLCLVPSDREGYYKYNNDWSDAKIASEIDPAIQSTAIANLRNELFGKLDVSLNITREDNQKFKELEQLYSNILACFSELELKHNRLVDTLALNKVANVAHLKTTPKEEKK